MLDILGMSFIQNALLAGLLCSVACGITGALVVVNRMVFLAGGIAHAAYGGVGLAFFLDLPVIPATIGFSSLSAVAMAGFTLKRTDRTDTLIGVIWAVGMAFGIILLDLTPGYNVDLMSYLFGSILTVSSTDLWLMAGLDVLLAALAAFFYQDFLCMSFDREFAHAKGIPVTMLHFLLPVMAAVSVVMLIRVVGLILVIALLTIPPFLAEKFSASLGMMMVLASVFSTVFCVCGLYVSYTFDISSGASIIAFAATAMALVLVMEKILSSTKVY